MPGNHFARSWGSAAYGLLLKDITRQPDRAQHLPAQHVGLYRRRHNRVTVSGNEFLANGWGVQVMADAQQTSFHRNRFAGNSFDVSTNSVQRDQRVRRELLGPLPGYDLDRDGFGDVPFAPVRLFALVVQQNEPALILLRSFFVSLLDAAERVAPVLTPQTMEDQRPLMRWTP